MSATELLLPENWVRILGFCERTDWDEFAMVSRRFREIRNNPGLDQARTGTIMLTKQTVDELADKIHRWEHVFTGNRSRLRIENLEAITMKGCSNIIRFQRVTVREGHQLEGVTSLDISRHGGFYHNYQHCHITANVLRALAFCAPNLRELTMDGVGVSDPVTNWFADHCPNLTTISWHRAFETDRRGVEAMDLAGRGLRRASNLRALYVEDSILSCLREEFNSLLNEEDDFLILRHCPQLERIDLKGVRLLVRAIPASPTGLPAVNTEPSIPQEGLIKLVRRSPSLKWFRSDLTEENLEMLRQEFPEILFVSETSTVRMPSTSPNKRQRLS